MRTVLEGFQKLNIHHILCDVLRRWRIIVLLVLAAGILSYGVLYCRYTADYSVSATLVVLTPEGDRSASGETVTLLSQLLSDSQLQQRMARDAGLDGFSGSATAAQLGNTNLIQLRVTSGTPALAMAEIGALMNCGYDITEDALGPVTVEVLEAPAPPNQPDRFRNPLSTAVRAMGLTLGALVLLFGYFSAKRQDGDENSGQRIDLFALLRHSGRRLKHIWWLPLLLAGLGAALSCSVARLRYSPVYRVSAVISVTAEAESDASQVRRQAGGVIPDLLTSQLLRNRVAEGLNIAPAGISIDAESLYGSNLIRLTVRADDPARAQQIYAALVEECPQVAAYVLGNVRCRELLHSGVPVAPYNTPVYWRQAVLGAGIAAAVFFGLLLLYGLQASKGGESA